MGDRNQRITKQKMLQNIKTFDAPKFPTVDRIRQWIPELCETVENAGRIEVQSVSDWFYYISKDGVSLADIECSYSGPLNCGPKGKGNKYVGPVYFFLDRALARALWRESNLNTKTFGKCITSKQEHLMRDGQPPFHWTSAPLVDLRSLED